MEPGFREFDRVFTYNWGKIQKGSVVVCNFDGTILLKRVKELNGDNIVLASDNKLKAKKDYKVKRDDIIGRVFLKY